MRDVYFFVAIGNYPDAAVVSSDPAHLPDQYAASLLERVAEKVVGNVY
jgi:hypothetical protein